jgi:hypothetical protein
MAETLNMYYGTERCSTVSLLIECSPCDNHVPCLVVVKKHSKRERNGHDRYLENRTVSDDCNPAILGSQIRFRTTCTIHGAIQAARKYLALLVSSLPTQFELSPFLFDIKDLD